jgi:putative redox protein
MEIIVESLGGVQFEITARLSSLGSCAAYYAVDYLKRANLEREGVKVRVTADKVKGPFRLDNFNIEVEIPGEIQPNHWQGVEDAVHRCIIHNTLLHPPQIHVVVHSTVGV